MKGFFLSYVALSTLQLFNDDRLRRFAVLEDLPHPLVCTLHMGTQTIGVEQRKSQAVVVELLSHCCEQCPVRRKLQGERLIFVERMRHELGKADCAEQACSDTAAECP